MKAIPPEDPGVLSLGLLLTNVCNRSCEFCFKLHKHPRELWMTDEDFETFLAWITRTGVNWLKICGGEPTLHPRFEVFLDKLTRSKVGAAVITNLTGRDAAVAAIRDMWVLVNSSSLSTMPESARAKLQRNLELISKQDNEIVLSFTLWHEHQSIDDVLDYAERYGARQVRIDFSRPSILRRDTRSVSTEQAYKLKPVLLDRARKILARGLQIGFDCTWPLDYFTDAEREELSPKKALWIPPDRIHLCTANYVNPDLTISSCPHQVVFENKLTDFEDYLELTEAIFQAKTLRLQRWGDPVTPYYCEAERFLKDKA